MSYGNPVQRGGVQNKWAGILEYADGDYLLLRCIMCS